MSKCPTFMLPHTCTHTTTVATPCICRSPVSLGNSPTPQMLAIHRAAIDQGRGPPRLDSHVEEALLEGSSEDGEYPQTSAAEPPGCVPSLCLFSMPARMQDDVAYGASQGAGMGRDFVHWCSTKIMSWAHFILWQSWSW